MIAYCILIIYYVNMLFKSVCRLYLSCYLSAFSFFFLHHDVYYANVCFFMGI